MARNDDKLPVETDHPSDAPETWLIAAMAELGVVLLMVSVVA